MTNYWQTEAVFLSLFFPPDYRIQGWNRTRNPYKSLQGTVILLANVWTYASLCMNYCFFVKTISYFLKEEIVNAWMRKLINRAKISYLELAFFVDCEVICRKDEVNFNFMSIFRVIHFFNHSWWIRRPARNARRCACLCNHHTIISRFGSRRPDFSTQRVFQWRYIFIDHLLHIC